MNQIKAKNDKKKKIYLKKETKEENENLKEEEEQKEEKNEDKQDNNDINKVKTGGFFITNKIDFEDEDQMKIVDGLNHINSLINEDNDSKDNKEDADEHNETNKKESIIKTEIEESDPQQQSNDNSNI